MSTGQKTIAAARRYKAAKRGCLDVHDGKRPIEALRKALVAPATQAGILCARDSRPK